MDKALLVWAFAEWDRRYRQNPDAFSNAFARLAKGESCLTYGEACATYFETLLAEAKDAK